MAVRANEPFRMGFVGAGMITANAHLPAAMASTVVQVTALVDTVPGRADRLAGENGLKVLTATKLDAVLDKIDGAVIATPNQTHRELAEQCLDAKIPVLIEKPLARTTDEGEAIAAAAERNRTVAAVGYCARFTDNFQLLRQLLDDDYFGRIHRFAYRFGAVGGWSSLSAFHLDKQAVGGGALVTVGTHFLDRMLQLFGYPRECSLVDDSHGGPEANALAKFRYVSPAGEFEGSLRLSRSVAFPAGLVMETERGTLLWRDGDTPLRFRPAGYSAFECHLRFAGASPFLPNQNIFQRQIEDFVRACRGAEGPLVPVQQGIEVIRIVEDLYANRKQMNMDWYNNVRKAIQ